jgi:hypothetical protein
MARDVLSLVPVSGRPGALVVALCHPERSEDLTVEASNTLAKWRDLAA